MKKTIIIKTGNSFPDIIEALGDFETWIIRAMELQADQVRIINVPEGDPLPEPDQCGRVVITGSHAMVTDQLDWSVAIEKWIPGIISADIPLLGICYGHQLLAHAMGGSVDYHPGGVEAGTVKIQCRDAANTDPLFRGLGNAFHVHATHSQTVTRLPDGAVLLAGNSFEGHHAFRIGDCAWGVQFHPEYLEETMAAYLRKKKELIDDLEKIINQIRPTPEAAEIIRRFAKLGSG